MSPLIPLLPSGLAVEQVWRKRIAVRIAALAWAVSLGIQSEQLLFVTPVLNPTARTIGSVQRRGGIVVQTGEFAEGKALRKIVLRVLGAAVDLAGESCRREGKCPKGKHG